MKKLSSPRSVRTSLGPIQATHETHEFQVINRPDNQRIISERRLLRDVDGELILLPDGPETRESVDITGDDLASLGESFTPADVLAVHERKIQAHLHESSKALAARQKAVEDEIKAAEVRLTQLKEQRTRG